MTYTEFLHILNKIEMDVGEFSSYFGYSQASIKNNWSRKDEVPPKAEIALKLYLELQQEKRENEALRERLAKSAEDSKPLRLLPGKALQIAERKCAENDVELEVYISSLIISTI